MSRQGTIVFLVSFILSVLLSGILLATLPENLRVFLGAFLYMAYSGIAASFLFFAFLDYGFESVQGKSLLAAFFAFLITSLSAGTIFLLEISGGKYVPGSGIADIIGALAYPLLFIALAYSVSIFGKISILKGASYYFTWFALSVLIFISLILPISRDASLPALDKTVILAYVVGDLVGLLLATIFVANFDGSRINLPWVLIACGAILIVLGDFAFGYLSWKGLYRPGNLTNLFWYSGCVLIIEGARQLSKIVREAKAESE